MCKLRREYHSEFLLFYLRWSRSREPDLHTGSGSDQNVPAPQHWVQWEGRRNAPDTDFARFPASLNAGFRISSVVGKLDIRCGRKQHFRLLFYLWILLYTFLFTNNLLSAP